MFIIHYHEIALKGGNRSFFESKLKQRLEQVLEGLEGVRVENRRDHLRVTYAKAADRERVAEQIGTVFGIANYSFVERMEPELSIVAERAAEMIREELERRGMSEQLGRKVTFQVRVHRTDKSYPMNSMEIAREISGELLPQFGIFEVNLKRAEISLAVNWGKDEVMLSVQKYPGLGGLPVGASGKVVSLLSSGFDSPVASWMMMRRGATVTLVHFHSYPSTGQESIENVKAIAQVLERYQGFIKLFLIPLIDFQKAVVTKAPAPLRVLLYRRMMFRLAERVMSYEHGKALVTGESLAQVASQTLDNMNVVNVLATRPVLRPLIGMDKQDIIAMAEKIGTAEISKQPYEDCCSLYVPKSPALAARVEELEKAEVALEVERFENELWARREVVKFGKVKS